MNYRAAAEELREFVKFYRDLKGQWLVRTSKRLAETGEPYQLLIPTGHYNVYEPLHIGDGGCIDGQGSTLHAQTLNLFKDPNYTPPNFDAGLWSDIPHFQ